MPKFEKLDAAETAFFMRELEEIRAKSYDIKYATLKGLNLVPIQTDDPGTEIVTYRQYDYVASAKLISSYGSDFPSADVTAKEFSTKFRDLGNSYKYNLRELRNAKRANRPLDQMRASAARRAIAIQMDKAVQNGLADQDSGLLGLLNQPNAITQTVAADGSDASGKWCSNTSVGNKTADQILRDMHGIVQFQVDLTKELEIPEVMGLPPTKFGYISTTRYSSTDGNTILKVFLANTPYITTVFSWLPLKAAGGAGADRGIIYRRDPDAIQFLMPTEFEQVGPQEMGLEWVTYCLARTGGLVAYYPMSICYFDGI